MSNSRIAVVTGANKGIGYAIVRQLALQYPDSQFNNGPLLVYLTARDQGRGEEALKNLQDDVGLEEAKALKETGGLTEVKYHPLDISETKSIQDLAEFLKKTHPDGIDFVVNNAAIALDGPMGGPIANLSTVEKTLDINYTGTLYAIQSLLPLIRDGGRMVNVSSTGGVLSRLAPPLQERFRSASTIEDITALMEEYKKATAEGNANEKGWGGRAYGVSKTGLTTATRVIAEEGRKKGSRTLINSCCPGLVKTDMARHHDLSKAKHPDQGAQTPVMLAIGDIKGTTGLFWRDEQVQEF